MQINVNSDNHVRMNDRSIDEVQAVLADALERFARRITRVEVHLSDVNGRGKGGDDDIRCALEARLAGMQPVAVSAQSGALSQALDAAAGKLVKLLERTLQKQDHPRGHKSVATDAEP
ncbi:MAG TPA: hypothetical protein PJ982_08265 [Lacipirellulaceae bacterium]|nr:hypothetical protein [Lacipirellulaceae bacterium]